MDLTKRQQEIFDFIKRYSEQHGYPPTVRDIGKAVGLASSSTVHAHLANLEKLGLLRRDPTKPRAMELLDRAACRRARGGATRVAAARAGRGRRADRCRGERGGVHRHAGGAAAGTSGEYLLRVRGESMKNAGILDGDLVVVRRQETARDGEIVVALVEEEATVKRFFREGDHIRLQPENETMEPDPGARRERARPGGRTDAQHVIGLRTIRAALCCSCAD